MEFNPMRLLQAAVSLCIALSLGGCASIVSDSKYPVSITSSPSGAAYQINNEKGVFVHSGVTPDQVILPAGAGYFDGERYQITFKKDGYNGSTSIVNSGLNGWYWGNILFGGIIGMLIVDPATGAMYKLPAGTYASLSPIPALPVATQTSGGDDSKNREQLLNELAADGNLSYEEYQRRYAIIMRQP